MKKSCPQCGRKYSPRMSESEAKNSNDIVAREQHMTGICSRECYLKSVGSYVENLDDLENSLEKYGGDKLYFNLEEESSGEIDLLIDAVKIYSDEDWVEFFNRVDSQSSVSLSSKEELDNLIKEKIAYLER